MGTLEEYYSNMISEMAKHELVRIQPIDEMPYGFPPYYTEDRNGTVTFFMSRELYMIYQSNGSENLVDFNC